MKMPLDIEEVHVVLENCECYQFDSGDVNVYLDGLGKHIWDGVSYNTVEHVALVIKKEAEARAGSPLNGKEDWKERIHRDITQVWLKYEDGSSEGYHVDWDIERSEFENRYEKDLEEGEQIVYIISKSRKSLKEF